MKKIVLIVVIISLVGCFKQEEKVLITRGEDKIVLIEKIVQNDDKESEIEYNEITKKLRKQSENGNQIAHKELKEWEDSYFAKKNIGKTPKRPTFD